MPSPTTTRTPFNVMITPEEKGMLDLLANRTGVAKSLILRQALRSFHQMAVLGTPTCADGNRCMCPQMHPEKPS